MTQRKYADYRGVSPAYITHLKHAGRLVFDGALVDVDESDELAELDRLLDDGRLFVPLPWPQTMAYFSTADIIGYGGAAGGGKSMLAIGKALTQHHKPLIIRREATQLVGIIDEFAAILGTRDGYTDDTIYPAATAKFAGADLRTYWAVEYARRMLRRLTHREAVLHSIRRAFCRDYIEAGTILSAAERAEAA